jgi:dihydrolipoamide dehydrogenase
MSDYDLIILGGGPGGYAAAVRAGRLGLKTALVEKELLGGTCINWGCVPTKALLRFAKLTQSRSTDSDAAPPVEYSAAHDQSCKIARERRERLETLLKNSGVALYTGKAHLLSSNAVQIHGSADRLVGRNILIATGSAPRQIPGAANDGVNIITTREALSLSKAPASAVIVGSGSTGMEFATIWSRFGTKVTVLELMPTILGTDDVAISSEAAAHFREVGIQIRTGITVESVVSTPAGVEVKFGDAQGEETLIVEKALIAAGITPNSDNLGLEALEVDMECGNHIKIDRQMRTNIPGVYAVGDVTGKLPLAFAAAEQAMIAVEAVAGHETKDLAYESIPRCTYSDIEMATVGLTEKQARERGHEITIVKEPVPATSMASGKGGGFIKLIADAKTTKALGATILGGDATGQIAIPARMISLGATVPELLKALSPGRQP